MSAIASSTVSTVPSATAFFSSSTVTGETLRRRRPDRWLLADLFLEVDLAHLPGEVLAGAGEPGDRSEEDHHPHHQRRVVERLPGEFVVPRHRQRGEREAEDDRDQPDPEGREEVHPPVLAAVVPRPGLEVVAHPPAQ